MKKIFLYVAIQVLYSLCIITPVCAQIVKLPHADTTNGNYFGTAVALHGTRAIVGASGETSCDVGGGAAYIFEFTEYWKKIARLLPSDCEQGLAFGRKVAINKSIALVAASQDYFASIRPNAVYVFEETDTGEWIQTARLSNREETAVAAVAIDNHHALFTTAGDPTPHRQKDGTVYVYEKRDDTWIKKHQLSGSGNAQRGVFGGDTALHSEILAVASSSYFSKSSGSVYLFEPDAQGSWSEVARLGGMKDFFISLDLYGNELIVGQSKAGIGESGRAILYTRNPAGAWISTATLTPPTPYRKGAFGTEVALHRDRALVVGYDEQLRMDFNVDRVVYIYARQDGIWHYRGIIDIGESSLGSSIDLYENTALIGAAGIGEAYVIKIP